MDFINIEDGVDKFTCILNTFFTDYKEDKNKIDELYQYYFLSEYRLLNNKKYVFVSINLIVQSGFKLVSDERRNLLRVKEVLLTLREKGFLEFDVGDKFDNNTPLLIAFSKEPDINKKKDSFTMLYRWMFELANDSKEFFVYAYIAKWSGISNYKISLLEWADVLGYSGSSSVQRYLNKLEKEKKLIVEHGQYILQNRQEMNKYSINKNGIKDDNLKPKVAEKIKVDTSIIPEGIPTWYDCPESNKKDKRFSSKEIREDILNNGKISTEHYFYAHEFEQIDPVIFEEYQLSMKRLSKSNFDFSKDAELWDKKVKEIKFREDNNNRERLINKMIEENDHVLFLDDNTYCLAKDVTDWKKVKGFQMVDKDYSFDGKGDFKNFVLDIIKNNGTLNDEVYKEIGDKWKLQNKEDYN